MLIHLFLSTSATELVKSLSFDADKYCFIIFFDFTFVIHFCICVERVYFNKGKGKFHLHHTLKAYKVHGGKGVKIHTVSYSNFTGNKILNFYFSVHFGQQQKKLFCCCWELYLRWPAPIQ